MNNDLKKLIPLSNNIASLVNTLRSLTGLSFSSFKHTLHLSKQDLKLLESAKELNVENELFSINCLCKFYIFSDSIQDNEWNNQMLKEFAQHVKKVCKDELVTRSFIL